MREGGGKQGETQQRRRDVGVTNTGNFIDTPLYAGPYIKRGCSNEGPRGGFGAAVAGDGRRRAGGLSLPKSTPNPQAAHTSSIQKRRPAKQGKSVRTPVSLVPERVNVAHLCVENDVMDRLRRHLLSSKKKLKREAPAQRECHVHSEPLPPSQMEVLACPRPASENVMCPLGHRAPAEIHAEPRRAAGEEWRSVGSGSRRKK